MVTEQMLIHAQEFNIRLDSTEKLINEIHQEIMQKLYFLQDRIDMIEFLSKDIKSRLSDTGNG